MLSSPLRFPRLCACFLSTIFRFSPACLCGSSPRSWAALLLSCAAPLLGLGLLFCLHVLLPFSGQCLDGLPPHCQLFRASLANPQPRCLLSPPLCSTSPQKAFVPLLSSSRPPPGSHGLWLFTLSKGMKKTYDVYAILPIVDK